MTREDVKNYRRELTKLLDDYADSKGVQINLGSISFSNNNFHVKLSLIEAETVEDAEKLAWEGDFGCFHHQGLKLNHYGKSFNYGDKTFTICGVKIKSRTKPLLARSGGSVYKFPVDVINLIKE